MKSTSNDKPPINEDINILFMEAFLFSIIDVVNKSKKSKAKFIKNNKSIYIFI